MDLYSPPNKGYPQELPDRWRFDDGTVRTDLKYLNKEQLAALKWVGPIYIPVQRQKDQNGNDLIEKYDYDPSTHKSVWYKAKQAFVIVKKDVNEEPYLSGKYVKESTDIANWGEFKVKLLSSQKVNQFIATGLSYAPAASITLPSTILNIEIEGYEKFAITWNSLISVGVPIPNGMLEEVIGYAKAAHLPKDFLDIIS